MDSHEEHAEQRSSSPVTGEKRQRVEDDTDHQEHPAGNQESDDMNAGPDQDYKPSTLAETKSPNGASSMTTVNQPMNGAGAGQGAFDALYIGDLQWVCLSICLVPDVQYRSETTPCIFFVSYSGQLMRIFGKSLSMSV